ncbi:phage tail protein [Agrobacterium sp. S2/73]|uniref:phage tail protein n=1 Tax=unclassified Agrobacterium TaxID=2632611 RepID=UPI001ADD14A5|nr:MULTISPECIES: phage tail protein [unclassified Agrobacterium]MBO9108888.1 phage tail protein [Agrobacterium sp. S2/73]QXZ73361.1 phage tail protein [Agrobacterium sp. S7/73]
MAIFSLISSVATAVSGFIGSLGAFGSFLLKTAVGVGVSLLAQSLAGKTKDPTFSINGTLQGGGDVPRSFILGRTATAGSLVFVNTWGQDGDTPNAYLTQVIALSDMPIRGLAEVWVNGERVTLGGLTDRGYAVNEYPDSLWVKFYDGTQTTADSFLFTSVSNGNRWWNPDRIGRGVAYAIVTARVSKNMFSGVPSFKFVLEGMRLYDISRDSTQGGVGTHRYADPATWGGDGDFLPAVQIYNLLRGISYNGQWFYGLQNLSSARLPASAWIAQIEKNRAGTLESTGWVNTYRSGGEVQVEAPLTSAVEALLTACQGKISEVGGVYYLHSGAPDAPVIAFTDDDILSTEEQEFTPFLGLADTINGVSANYPSPQDGWVSKTAPPLYRTDLEAIDGNRRLMADVDLNFVPYAEQVQRLMRSALEEARRFRRHTIVLPPKYWAYATPGTVFSWTSERNGYIAKLMRLDGVADRANLDVMIDITEVDPADYDWNTGADFKPPVDGQLGVIRPSPQAIVDWFAEPATIKDAAGDDRRPAIRLTWDNSDGRLDDVIGIEYEVRLQATLEKISEGRTDQPQVGSMLISQGLLPNESYVVRGRYIPGGDRPVLWSGFIPVITPNVLLSDKDVFVDVDLSGIDKQLSWLYDNARSAKDRIQALIASQLELPVVAMEHSESIRRSLSLALGNARADYNEKIEVAVSETSAVALKVEELSVSFNGSIASLTSQVIAVADANQALAGRVDEIEVEFGAATAGLSEDILVVANATSALATRTDTLTAALGGNSAEVRVKWEASAGPSGYDARFGIVTVVNDGSTRAASFMMDAPSNPSLPTRILMQADQILMYGTDPSSLKRPFVFQGGVLYLDDVRVNSLSALSGELGNVNIENAIVGNLQVGTSNIASGAISDSFEISQSGSTPQSLVVNHGVGAPRIYLFYSSELVTSNNQIGAQIRYDINNDTDGGVIGSIGSVNPGVNNNDIVSASSFRVFVPPSGRTQTTFRISRYAAVNLTTSARLIAMVLRR